MSALGEVLGVLLEHLDVVELVIEAIGKGVSKDTLKKSIRDEMIKASDAEMRRELGG